MKRNKYINKLKKKIDKKLNKDKITNDDLHDLFHYYDFLDHYMYYENGGNKKFKEELLDEQII